MQKIRKKRELAEYLKKEAQFNVYMLGDLDNYGLDDPDVEFFVDDEEYLHVVLMRFHGSFVLYSHDNDFQEDIVIRQIIRYQDKIGSLDCVSGKFSSIKKIASRYSDIRIRCTYILNLDRQHQFYHPTAPFPIKILKEDQAEILLQQYVKIPEMDDKFKEISAEAVSNLKNSMKTGKAFGIIKDSIIISSITTTAENEDYAMLINVCTLPEHRKKGLCAAVLYAACKELFKEGKKKIFIYYENEEAGNIYKKQGFQYIGDYGRILLNSILKI